MTKKNFDPERQKRVGELIKREIKFARPAIRFQQVADLLGLTYQQLFGKFRIGSFTDEELEKIMDLIGGRHEHYIVTEDGRRIDL